VRPGHRRSLVRRALIGIVLANTGSQKEAYVARAPIIELSHAWDGLHCGEKFVSAALGIVHDQELSKAVQKARLGRRIALAPLARAFKLELWLRRLMLEQGLHGCKKKLSPGSFEEETIAPAH